MNAIHIVNTCFWIPLHKRTVTSITVSPKLVGSSGQMMVKLYWQSFLDSQYETVEYENVELTDLLVA